MNANRYTYAANNPVNYVDATGAISAAGWVGIGLAIVGSRRSASASQRSQAWR
jgi:hypothetical protein